MLSPIYVHIKKGATKFKPGDLVAMGHAVRADYWRDDATGDSVGKVMAISGQARQILEADPGITVLPPLHRPIKQEHADAFGHGASAGDDGYSVAEKLFAFHGLFWMHPDEPGVHLSRVG